MTKHIGKDELWTWETAICTPYLFICNITVNVVAQQSSLFYM